MSAPFILMILASVFCAGFWCGWTFLSLAARPGASTAPTEDASDPDLDRLVGMGFPADLVKPQLQKARMKGETDPVGYAMRALIR